MHFEIGQEMDRVLRNDILKIKIILYTRKSLDISLAFKHNN